MVDYTVGMMLSVPMPLTPLLGRQQELATLQQLLRHPEVRLVTLTGPGGVGKTRLALQAGHDAIPHFADGVRFISLAAISDPALVIPAIGRALGLQEEGQRPFIDRLTTHLQHRQQLLLLDNFEQVIAAAPQLLDILIACPDLKLIVTSREVLRLRGEHEFAVPLFPLPDLPRLGPLKQGMASVLAQNTAVALFVERAQASKTAFQLTDDNALTIAKICAHLNGLPLAIELAAARVKLFSPEALLIHLSQTLETATLTLLNSGTRDAPVRQQTLRNTIQWSYDLLQPAEKQLFQQLAVFVGGFTLAAAEYILPNPSFVWDGMTSLIDKSLVQPIQGGDQPRFSMLVMIREFAAEQLALTGAATAVHQAHATYFLTLAEAAVPYLRGHQQEQWLNQLEQEHDNLRAALQWTLDNGQGETAVRLGNALWSFWLLRGYLNEGQRWLEKLLTINAQTVTGRLLVGAGVLNYYQGNPQRSITLLKESLVLSREINDKAGIVAAQQGLARVAMRGGRYEEAITLYQHCLALSQEMEDEWGVAHALAYLGLTHWNKGNFIAARPFLEDGLARFRHLGDAYSMAQSLQALGFVESSAGNLPIAQALFEESLTLCRRLSDKAGTGRALYALGLIASLQQKPLLARDLLAEALALWQELGDYYHSCGSLALVANLALNTGQTEQSATLWSALTHFMHTISSAPPAQVKAIMHRGQKQAQSKLGEQAFAAALRKGQGLTWEQICELGSTILVQVGEETAAAPTTYPAGLTEREVDVLRLLTQGFTNAQIAAELVVSPYTVNAHLRSIYNKLDVSSRAAATRYALEHNLL